MNDIPFLDQETKENVTPPDGEREGQHDTGGGFKSQATCFIVIIGAAGVCRAASFPI